MPALPDAADLTDGPEGVRDELVDQRRLADPGLAEQHRHLALQAIPECVDARPVPGDERLDAQRLVQRQQLVGRREVALGQAEQRDQPPVVRRDEAPVDQPWPWHRVGQRGDDDEHLGVGDDGPLDRVGVVRGAAQQRGPRLDPDDPAESVGAAAELADQGHPVAGDDGPATQLAGPDAGDQHVVVGAHPVAAAVDGDHPAG